MYQHDTRLLERRARLTEARIESQNTSIVARESEHQRYSDLVRDGLVADKTSRDSAQLLNQERRDWLTLNDELARIQQQRTALEQTHHAGLAQRAHELSEALARRDAARLLIEQTELRAARAGRIESLAVGPGDVVAPGFVVARLVSLGNARHVAAFLPERDRAFVRPNMQVRLEIDRLPVGEFGSAAARIVRVSSEIASQTEIERALGAAAPEGVHFGVDLELSSDARTVSLLERAGSGTLLTARLPLRRRRVISLIFDPIRKWLD
jgi:multidrug resistance efflux pump